MIVCEKNDSRGISYFAPVSEEYLNIRPVAVAYAWPLCAKRDDIHKTRSTEHTALLSEEDQATAAGNMHIKSEV